MCASLFLFLVLYIKHQVLNKHLLLYWGVIKFVFRFKGHWRKWCVNGLLDGADWTPFCLITWWRWNVGVSRSLNCFHFHRCRSHKLSVRWLAAGYKALFRVSHAEHSQSLEWHCESIAVVHCHSTCFSCSCSLLLFLLLSQFWWCSS